jgi:hypothetical protein
MYLGKAVGPPHDGKDVIFIDIVFKNSGQTPAYDFTTSSPTPLIREKDSTPFDDLEMPKPASSSVLFSQSTAGVQHRFVVSAEDIAAIRAGTRKVFIWGKTEYRDTFGRSRHFEFYDVNGDETGHNSGRWLLRPHSRGYKSN